MTRLPGLCLLAALAIWAGSRARATEAVVGDHVVLKSGRVLAGRVVGSEMAGEIRLLRVETDFGQIMVPQGEVKHRVVSAPEDGSSVFQIRQVRVLQWTGLVEKRPGDSRVWRPIDEVDRYSGKIVVNEANAYVGPGDSIRTGTDSSIDLLPHKDVWIRIAANSEVTIPAVVGGEEPEETIRVRSGTTIQRVKGKPRGGHYRVRTPSAVVDHEFVMGGKDSFFSLGSGGARRLVVVEGAVKTAEGHRVDEGQAADARGAVADAPAAALAALRDEAPRVVVDDMVYVPGATWRLGEGDGVEVELGGFLIDRREVTNDEYAAFAEATGGWVPAYFERGRPPAGREREPVFGIPWEGAVAFANWAGKSLPLEAQWEAAAFGGRRDPYPWGGDRATLFDLATGTFRLWEWTPPERLPSVDDATPDVSWIGVRAMASGVPEWCRDVYSDHLYAGGAPFGPLDGEAHAVRGWHAAAMGVLRRRSHKRVRSANRPGLRCVIELPPVRRPSTRDPGYRELLPLDRDGARQARSPHIAARTSILFVNRTASAELFWVDEDGSRVPYGRLPAGRSLLQATRVGHAWVVRDQEAVCTYVATKPPGRVWVGPAPLPRLEGRKAERARSKEGGSRTAIRFVNGGGRPVEIFWIDPRGKRVSHGSLAPGRTLLWGTAVGHVWMVAEEDGEVLGVYVAQEHTGSVVIEG